MQIYENSILICLFMYFSVEHIALHWGCTTAKVLVFFWIDPNYSIWKSEFFRQYYSQIQKGIGVHKSPEDYGSFPFEPYSHTPRMAGVQQRGMTGQVKEDSILNSRFSTYYALQAKSQHPPRQIGASSGISRFFELDVSVQNGQIEINPLVLKKSEFIVPQPDDN